MKGIMKFGPVVIEIRRVENGELAVPINNILVRHTAFLATDTQPCVLVRLTATLPSVYFFNLWKLCMIQRYRAD